MDISPYFSLEKICASMRPHYERYKKWNIAVEISGDSLYVECDEDACAYLPRIVVSEPLSIGFRDLQVPVTTVYRTAECCMQAGVVIARQFIDARS